MHQTFSLTIFPPVYILSLQKNFTLAKMGACQGKFQRKPQERALQSPQRSAQVAAQQQPAASSSLQQPHARPASERPGPIRFVHPTECVCLECQPNMRPDDRALNAYHPPGCRCDRCHLRRYLLARCGDPLGRIPSR